MDIGIGILLLRATPEQLPNLQTFPDVLERLGLDCSRGALLCALGHDDDFYKNLASEGETAEELFRKLGQQPIGKDVAPVLNIDTDGRTVLHSKVWGCVIRVSCPLASPYLELAESILAATEATLATAGRERIVATTSRVDLNVVAAECQWFEFNADHLTDESACEISCGNFDASCLRREDQFKLRDKICDLVSNILVRVFYVADFEVAAQKLFGEERGFERGTNLTTSFVTLANILGKTPRLKLGDWTEGNETIYEKTRAEHWNAFQDRNIAARTTKTPEGDATRDRTKWRGFDDVHQREIETISLIHAPLWDSACWKGTAFLWSPKDIDPPLLGLCFQNGDAASKIFARWRTQFGDDDSNQRLRIVILRGIKRTNRFAYRICLTADLESSAKQTDDKY